MSFVLLFNCSYAARNNVDCKKSQTVNNTQTEKKEVVIGVLPLGDFNQNLITVIKAQITIFYDVKVVVLPMLALPQTSYLKSRDRYVADSLLDFILLQQALKEKNNTPNHCDYIVGLTEKDICTSHNNSSSWGVFGLGFMPGKACVISTLRLKKNANYDLLTIRLIKVVLHELGHNFGLDHCKTPGCMMRDAEGTIKSVDNEKMDICKVCKGKLNK
jgi:archaemetzincin